MTKEEIDLIKGVFTPIQAQEIINHMIDKKIQFHNLKNFSDDIRFGIRDENISKRVMELQESRSVLQKKILEAIDEGKKLKIKSTIEIEFI